MTHPKPLPERQPHPEPSTAVEYQSGFGNEHSAEALTGALPIGQNSPQRCPYGLYAEQISGSAFTAPRHHNLRSWLYRARPSVIHHQEFEACALAQGWESAPLRTLPSSLGPRRWAPLKIPSSVEQPQTWIEGIQTFTASGSVDASHGMAAHLYVMNQAMRGERGQQYLVNADGEMLIVPQLGALRITTEMGILDVEPCEMAVVPRGITFQVDPLAYSRGGEGDALQCRGYICENYGAPFELPYLGPIGANCLANPRDFLYPLPAYTPLDGLDEPCELFMRWGGRLYRSQSLYSPMDVVAWHGNYAPYKYDLRRFSTIGSISFDHPDPSIFTVLTSPSSVAGVANVDFVIFPERWLVAEHSFRPPWFHRNIMSEFMGLITGQYDAKEEGFLPGGASLHTQMLAHGPDTEGFVKASAAALAPQKLVGTLAFMFETRAPQHITRFAEQTPLLEHGYRDCWAGLPRLFDGTLDPSAD